MKASLVVDTKFIEIFNLLRRRGRRFYRRLEGARKNLLENQVSGGRQKELQGSEVEAFLRSHTKRLINEIRALFKNVNNYHVIFILCRLPLFSDWRNKTNKSAINRRLMALDIAISAGEGSKAIEIIKGPDITEDMLWAVLWHEELCAELHFAQSVYRTIEKAAFFGVPQHITFSGSRYHSVIPNEVNEAIFSFENRCDRNAGALYAIDSFLPDQATTQLGLCVVLPRQPVDQPILCPDETNSPFLPDPLDRRGTYICIVIDATRKLKEILRACDIRRMSKVQVETIKSLFCLAALRQHLLEIRCRAIAEGLYGYDLEIKGYIKVSRSANNGLLGCLMGIINDCAFSETFDMPNEYLESWIAMHATNYLFPDSLDYELSSSIAIKLNHEQILYFPILFDYLEFKLLRNLVRGGEVAAHFGQSFEDWAIAEIRSNKPEQWGWCEWVVQQKLYTPDSNMEFDEIDYSCYKDSVLFIVDMKDSRERLSLRRKEAKANWNKVKREYYRSESETAARIVKHKNEMNISLPDINYIVPIVCVSSPVFTKIGPEYCLVRDIDGVPVPRACTTDEFIKVLQMFDLGTYIQDGGHYLAI